MESYVIDWSNKKRRNVFENAFFGKLYSTSDDLKAIYLYKKNNLNGTTYNWLLKEGEEDCLFIFNDDGTSPYEYEWNIIGEI